VCDGVLYVPLPKRRLGRAGTNSGQSGQRCGPAYETVFYIACARIHLVDPRTGKVLGSEQ
jgi:hypothetical protein